MTSALVKYNAARHALAEAHLVPAQSPVTLERSERDDDPITLEEACKLFPRAHLTVSTLRAERDRERLNTFFLGRREYTTEADMRAMVRSSKDESSRRASTSATNADNSATEQAKSAAALNQITSALKRSA